MKNSFAALQQDDDSSDSDVEDIPESEYRTEATPVRQSGGDLILRVDPLVGLKVNGSSSSLNTLPVELGFNNDDLSACIRVIDALGNNPNLFKLPALKSLRAALHPLIMEQMKNYDVPTSKANDRRKRRRKDEISEEEERALLRQERDAKLEAEYINQTQLRAIRLQQLELLNSTEGLENIPRVPDGVALIKDSNDCTLMVTNGSEATKPSSSQKPEDTPRVLRDSISCYICHKPYKELHHFYHQLCPDCAVFNFSKRNEMVDMTGKVCIVTGARAKIGYQAALKLLRCGAYVIATTRFPVDACKRYQAESDSSKWVHRLHVYGLDFRDMNGLEAFCAFVESHYERLDVIINNAAQTVRRPPAYYAHLIAGEELAPETATENPVLHSMLSGQLLFKTSGFESNFVALENGKETQESDRSNLFDSESSVVVSNSAGLRLPANTLTASSAMTQLCTTPEDNLLQQASMAGSSSTSSGSDGAVVSFGSSNSILFPKGATDVNNQQVDLRKTNSWTMKLHEVSTAEMAEVFAINAIAPAVINARLKKMMERNMEDYKFIVNVSAMEGKFYRYKSENHPHTNMAKASLNMMTRTSAQDYVKSNIYMTCVDTGWINDEKPIELAVNHEKTHNFQTPIDELDAASRVLDPVIGSLVNLAKCGITKKPLAGKKGKQQAKNAMEYEPPWGHFLKDYVKCEW